MESVCLGGGSGVWRKKKRGAKVVLYVRGVSNNPNTFVLKVKGRDWLGAKVKTPQMCTNTFPTQHKISYQTSQAQASSCTTPEQSKNSFFINNHNFKFVHFSPSKESCSHIYTQDIYIFWKLKKNYSYYINSDNVQCFRNYFLFHLSLLWTKTFT